MSRCFLYDAAATDAFGDCCETLGVTAKPLWFYAAISLPIELSLVALAQREDGSIGERRTRRETAVFAFLTLLALVLIVLRIVLPDEDGNRVCSGGWECYQAVVFSFTNSSALITCLVLWLRVEFKRQFWALYAVARTWLQNPLFTFVLGYDDAGAQAVEWLWSGYAASSTSDLRERGREGTTKAAEHYFAMAAVLGAGGLTHALPSLFAYGYLFVALLLLALTTHALRVGPLKDRTVLLTLVSPPLAAIALVLHFAAVLSSVAVGLVILLATLLVVLPARWLRARLAEFREARAAAAARRREELAAAVSRRRKEEEEAALSVDVEKETIHTSALAEEADEVVLRPPRLRAPISRLRSEGGAAYGAAAPAPEPAKSLAYASQPPSPQGGAGRGGDDYRAALSVSGFMDDAVFSHAPEVAQERVLEKQGKRAADRLVQRLQWMLKEIKKVVLFDPLGHVVVWGGALVMTSFALAANYSLLLYSGAPYAEAPVVDFFARDAGRFFACYGQSFSSFAWQTSLLGMLELALFAFGVGGVLVQVGSAVLQF